MQYRDTRESLGPTAHLSAGAACPMPGSKKERLVLPWHLLDSREDMEGQPALDSSLKKRTLPLTLGECMGSHRATPSAILSPSLSSPQLPYQPGTF